MLVEFEKRLDCGSLISSFVEKESLKQHQPEPCPVIPSRPHDPVYLTNVRLYSIRMIRSQQEKPKVDMCIQNLFLVLNGLSQCQRLLVQQARRIKIPKSILAQSSVV